MKGKDFIQKIRKSEKEELNKELAVNKDRLWNLKSDLAAGKIKNVTEIKLVKKNIARIKGVLKEKH